MSACDRCLALSTLTVVLAKVPRFACPAACDPHDADHTALAAARWAARVREAVTPGELLALVNGVSPARALKLAGQYPRSWSPERLRARCAEHGLDARCSCDDGYPGALRELSDAPPVIYIRGDAALLERCPEEAIAMVGTRRPTLVGREAARRIAAGVARSDGIVISGMALGIDAAAHEGALSVGGATIAVLASGADRPSPSSHRRLYAELLERGAVLSELPPGTEPTRWSFPARNRVIAALSKVTLVVEAPLRSGALITVEHAQDLGRDVCAVPGSLASECSEGSNKLLCDGAAAVVDGADLAASLGLQRLAGLSGPTDGPLAEVHAALSRGPLSTDELGRQTSSMGPGELEVVLLDLELAGWVVRRPDGRYRVVDRWAA